MENKNLKVISGSRFNNNVYITGKMEILKHASNAFPTTEDSQDNFSSVNLNIKNSSWISDPMI
jgi:hypothetical protein